MITLGEFFGRPEYVHFYLCEHKIIILINPVQAFEEKINESMEEELIIALQRLLENDWSYEAEELIFKFRTNVAQTTATQSPESFKHLLGLPDG